MLSISIAFERRQQRSIIYALVFEHKVNYRTVCTVRGAKYIVCGMDGTVER